MSKDKSTSGLLRKLAKFPIDNLYFAAALGFITGAVLWAAITVSRNTYVWVGLMGMAKFITVIIALVLLVTMWNKKRLGDAYSNQHWLERITSFIFIASFGFGASAVANNAIAFFLSLPPGSY